MKVVLSSMGNLADDQPGDEVPCQPAVPNPVRLTDLPLSIEHTIAVNGLSRQA
jgi:hypothetical protein